MIGVDLEKAIPDRTLTLAERPIAPVEHAGVRVRLRRPLPRLPPLLGAHRRAGVAPVRARARDPDQGARRLLRRPGLLRLARDQALQDPRAGAAGALPRLHALRLLPRRAPRGAGPLGPLPRQDDRRARGAVAQGSPDLPRRARALGARTGAPRVGRRRAQGARALHERRGSGLPDAVARGPDAVGRRVAAHRARFGARGRVDRHPLRPRRADDRPARRRHPAAARDPPAPGRPRQHGGRRRARSRKRSRPRTT